MNVTIARLSRKARKLQTKIAVFTKLNFPRRLIIKAVMALIKTEATIERLQNSNQVTELKPTAGFNKKPDSKILKLMSDRFQDNPRVIESGERVSIVHRNGEISIIGTIELERKNKKSAFNSKQHAIFEAIGQFLKVA